MSDAADSPEERAIEDAMRRYLAQARDPDDAAARLVGFAAACLRHLTSDQEACLVLYAVADQVATAEGRA